MPTKVGRLILELITTIIIYMFLQFHVNICDNIYRLLDVLLYNTGIYLDEFTA